MMERMALVCGLALALVACGESKKENGGDRDAGNTETVTIGATGGELAVEGLSMMVPAGALSEDTEITVTFGDDGPSGASVLSHVYTFEPSGLTFANPVSVVMDFSGDGENAAMLWSGSGSTYDDVTVNVTGQKVTGTSTHFSKAFVADKRVKFAGFGGEDGGDATCGPAFNNTLWTCVQQMCASQFAECFGANAASGTFQGGCADYGACICNCEADDANCTCMNDTNCTSCELESGLQDCIMTNCVN